MTTRKQYSPAFKARVAIGATRSEKTLSQLGSQSKVHPIQSAKWRKSALGGPGKARRSRPSGGVPENRPDASELLKAFEKQLGLKVRLKVLPLRMLVINRMNRIPTEN